MVCCYEEGCLLKNDISKIKPILYVVFFINLTMFFIEIISGIIINSSSLIADSMDMFGDAFVYGLSLFVLSKNHIIQAKTSLLKGVMMLLIGLFVFFDVFYKIITPVLPHANTIMYIGVLALIANIICFLLLVRHKEKNINLYSAWICSRNDIIASFGVILTGLLVSYFNSMWPDVIIGICISSFIIYFSVKIIKESIKMLR